MSDISTLSNSLVGLVCPFLTQVVRDRWIRVNDQSAHWLSLAVAAGCVLAASWINRAPFDYTAISANIGMAFTLSQVVYHNVLRDNDNGRQATLQMTKVADAEPLVDVAEDTPHP